jgi:hypothetical protein
MATAYPSDAARSRYAGHFSSNIFEPVAAQSGNRLNVAGKRRDQTTAELFGTDADKELRAMPKTFEPKHDPTSARQKRLNFLHSEVLPKTVYQSQASPAAYNTASPTSTGRQGFQSFPAMEEDEEEARPDPRMQRQYDHSSELFGRETPMVTQEQVYDRSRRLTPNDYKWFSHPEKVTSRDAGDNLTHSDRHYHEKCSQVFDHASPEAHVTKQLRAEEKTLHQNAETEGEMKRRANVYYSDLFGRQTPMDMPEQNDVPHRPKHRGGGEDKIVVHQDWTDSRTEILHRSADPNSRPGGAKATPGMRKGHELHQTRIFHESKSYAASEPIEPLVVDNSNKTKGAIGLHTQQIHQAHLRTSITPTEFYEEANNTKHWEVVELYISGLTERANEQQVRELCSGFDLHIVKVSLDMDYVRNLCKGRAKVMVRYNPKRDSIHGLVRKLEEGHYRVEL